MFVNTLTPDGKYQGQYCENLQLPIQMQLSEKGKTFSQFFVPFLESPSNFKHFKKKMMVIANVFPNFQTVKNFVTPLYQNWPFGTHIDSRPLKVSQILAKSPWQHLYHFSSSFWGKFIWKISPLVLGEI